MNRDQVLRYEYAYMQMVPAMGFLTNHTLTYITHNHGIIYTTQSCIGKLQI